MKHAIVDTVDAIGRMMDGLNNLPNLSPSLYLDLAGNNLSRHGTTSLLTLFIQPSDTVYIVDVKQLGSQAFDTPVSGGNTLKSILESSSTVKVFFDIRNDSDALFGHFQLRLAGVHDLQLMELASRKFSKRCVNGLARCIENDSDLTPAQKVRWKAAKDAGIRRFDPRHGEGYEVFDVRPLAKDIIIYCVQDVTLLPILWCEYRDRLTQSRRTKIETETQARIRLSQSNVD